MSTRAKASTSKESASAPTTTLSAEQLRRKAKFQLLGSAVLVALGVVLFAVLLDSPPRPNTNEVSILIPARDSLAPLALPSSSPSPAATPAASAPSAVASSSAAPVVAAPSAKSAASGSAPTVPAASAAAPSAQPAPAPAAATAPASAAKPALPASKATEAASAPANSASAALGTARFVVQVGAFTDAQKIRDVRAKLERAGFKTYAQVIQNNDGQRTRVRVGPFATKAEAEKAAAKIKSLDLPAALLTL